MEVSKFSQQLTSEIKDLLSKFEISIGNISIAGTDKEPGLDLGSTTDTDGNYKNKTADGLGINLGTHGCCTKRCDHRHDRDLSNIVRQVFSCCRNSNFKDLSEILSWNRKKI